MTTARPIKNRVTEMTGTDYPIIQAPMGWIARAQLANLRAVQAGEKSWESEIDGAPWTQQTFPYQAKCLKWTNERYRALGDADRASVDSLLAGTGVETMLGLTE